MVSPYSLTVSGSTPPINSSWRFNLIISPRASISFIFSVLYSKSHSISPVSSLISCFKSCWRVSNFAISTRNSEVWPANLLYSSCLAVICLCHSKNLPFFFSSCWLNSAISCWAACSRFSRPANSASTSFKSLIKSESTSALAFSLPLGFSNWETNSRKSRPSSRPSSLACAIFPGSSLFKFSNS